MDRSYSCPRFHIFLQRRSMTTEQITPVEAILRYLPPDVRSPVRRALPHIITSAHEIILRVGMPVCVYCADTRFYLKNNGSLTDEMNPYDLVVTGISDIRETLMSICEYSVYAHQEELKNGFVTLPGGSRVGLCGRAVMSDKSVVGMADITTLCFRIPREVKGCSDELMSHIDPERGVLLCGSPCCGKTTLLRDIARSLSYRYKVTLVDERAELSAADSGISCYDLGFCDTYLNMPKRHAVLNSIRSLSPDIIVCDELGDETDVAAVSYALRCGAAFIATVHASSIDDLKIRRVTKDLLSTGAFRYIVFLSDRRSAGKISAIYEWGD